MKEKEWNMKKTALIAATTVSIAVLSSFAFSKETRKVIKKRDKGKCQESGKSESAGWRLDAAHYDHNRSNPHYDHPDNGRMLGLLEHASDHLQRGDLNSAHLIIHRARKYGLHKKWYYALHRDAWEKDQQEINNFIEQNLL